MPKKHEKEHKKGPKEAGKKATPPPTPPPAGKSPAKGQETAENKPPATPQGQPEAPKTPPIPGFPCRTLYGSKVEVLGLVKGMSDLVWCQVGDNGQGFKNEILLADLEDTEELYQHLQKLRGGDFNEVSRMPKGCDRHGLTYEKAVAIQDSQLTALELVLESVQWFKLRKWCKKQNKPASSSKEMHHVPRGPQLMNWLIARGQFLQDAEDEE